MHVFACAMRVRAFTQTENVWRITIDSRRYILMCLVQTSHLSISSVSTMRREPRDDLARVGVFHIHHRARTSVLLPFETKSRAKPCCEREIRIPDVHAKQPPPRPSLLKYIPFKMSPRTRPPNKRKPVPKSAKPISRTRKCTGCKTQVAEHLFLAVQPRSLYDRTEKCFKCRRIDAVSDYSKS